MVARGKESLDRDIQALRGVGRERDPGRLFRVEKIREQLSRVINRSCRSERSAVSSPPGVSHMLHGLCYRLYDTAGLDHSSRGIVKINHDITISNSEPTAFETAFLPFDFASFSMFVF